VGEFDFGEGVFDEFDESKQPLEASSFCVLFWAAFCSRLSIEIYKS